MCVCAYICIYRCIKTQCVMPWRSHTERNAMATSPSICNDKSSARFPKHTWHRRLVNHHYINVSPKTTALWWAMAPSASEECCVGLKQPPVGIITEPWVKLGPCFWVLLRLLVCQWCLSKEIWYCRDEAFNFRAKALQFCGNSEKQRQRTRARFGTLQHMHTGRSCRL